MKKLVAMVLTIALTLSSVSADVSGFTKKIVGAKTRETMQNLKSYGIKKEKFIEYEKERVEKWHKWGNDILEKSKKGVKYKKEELEKAEKAIKQKERTYEEYLKQKEIRQKAKEYEGMLKYRNEFGFWRRFGSKIFGSWVLYIGNKNYPEEPKKKKSTIYKASGTTEKIPDTFDTTVEMPIELLDDASVELYFSILYDTELPFSDLFTREEKIKLIRINYPLAVPYEVSFENILEASEKQCKVIYEQLKVKSELGESQKETLLRLFVWDYEKRTQNKFESVYRGIGTALEEANGMMYEFTTVPPPTPIPIAY